MKEVSSSEVSGARNVEHKRSPYIDELASGKEKKPGPLRDSLAVLQQKENGIPLAKEKSPLTKQRPSESRVQEQTETPLPIGGHTTDLSAREKKPASHTTDSLTCNREHQAGQEVTPRENLSDSRKIENALFETLGPSGEKDGQHSHDVHIEQVTNHFEVTRRVTTLGEFTNLPDNTPVEAIGNAEVFSIFAHLQGQNGVGTGTCVVVASEHVLRQFDVKIDIDGVKRYPTEAYLVNYAANRFEMNENGGVALGDSIPLLQDFGVDTHAVRYGDQDELAGWLQEVKSVIIGVNANEWWNSEWLESYAKKNNLTAEEIREMTGVSDNGVDYNNRHVVVPTEFVRNLLNGKIEGFTFADSGTGEPKRFANTTVVEKAWADFGGLSIVSDNPYNSGGRDVEPPNIPKIVDATATTVIIEGKYSIIDPPNELENKQKGNPDGSNERQK